MNHLVHGIGETGRLIRQPVEAQNSAHARAIVFAANPDARALACRPLNHAGRVLDALASLPVGERVGVVV